MPDVVRQVERALGEERRLDMLRWRVDVSAEPDGAIVLEGEVPDLAAKKLALERAAAIPGVPGIVDRLRVAAQPMSDAELGAHVEAALRGEECLAGSHFEVRAEGGVVTLSGEVKGLAQKRLAGALAWWVAGARDVVNGLEVIPPEPDSDGETTDAVRLVLERDPLLDADGILVGTRDGVVSLDGTVPSEAQKRIAEEDAWRTFGVSAVVNHLTAWSAPARRERP